MQILRSDIYLLAFLLPFDVLLKCKNIELAIIIAFGLLLMTPKDSLAVILSTASSTNSSVGGAMQNADETKQLLLQHYADNTNSSWNKQVSSNSNNNKASPGGLIRCSSKLKCFDLNSALRMRNGGQLSGKDTYYSGSDARIFPGSNKVGKFNSRHLRLRRDHETNVIDTPSTSIEQQQQFIVQPKLMKNITQERSQQISSNHTASNQHRHHGADDLIKLKNSLEDLRNSSSSQGKETSVDSTHSSYNGFLKLIFFISIIFVILLIIIASIIYIWVIRRFSTNLEQINRRLPEVNHNLLNHSIQDFEALMLSVQNLGCAGMERLGSPPNFATSCSPQRDNRSIRRPTTIPIMQHDLKVSSNRQPQQSNNSSKAQQRQQCCYNNFNSGINNSHSHPSSDGSYHHRNNHQYTSCTSNYCPTHIQHPQHDGEFSRRIPSLDQCNDEIKRTYIQGPPNKTVQDVPDASNSHLPAYASLKYSSNIHNSNVNLCNNNLSNQKPSNNQQPHNNHHNSSSSSSQCRNDKMRKTSSNFLLDKFKFLRANSSSATTNVKSASVDFKTQSNASTTTPNQQKSNPVMAHTFPITSSVVTASSSGIRCAVPQHPTTAPQTEDSTERNAMLNGSTNINFSPSSSANLKVSSSASSLLSQTLSYSSECHGDINNAL